MKINDSQEPDYVTVKITNVGFIDEYGIEGLLVLKADDAREFHMHAFSGEVARHISSFHSGKETVPTIYKVLVKVKIYESGEALRANLYFTGKKDLVLRNYRASDAVALAVFYKIPILVRASMLREPVKV